MTTVHGVFASAKEHRALETGDIVFAAGDTGAQMFGIVSGSVELRDGDELVTTLGPGSTFGELAIISKAPRSLTAVAAEPTQIAVIDERTFIYLVHETPTFALQVMRSLAERIRSLDEIRLH